MGSRRGLRRAIDWVQEKAIQLTPFRTGQLERSSSTTVIEGTAEIVFDTDYAAQVHELPETAVGPGTREKPGNELGPAGPKYLERPMTAAQLEFPNSVVEEIRAGLQQEPVTNKTVPLAEVAEALEEIIGTVAEVVLL